jgi:hypothetical protein
MHYMLIFFSRCEMFTGKSGRPASMTGMRRRWRRLSPSQTAVAEAIAKSARTGAIGDGKLWACPADRALRVRAGERDDDAA